MGAWSVIPHPLGLGLLDFLNEFCLCPSSALLSAVRSFVLHYPQPSSTDGFIATCFMVLPLGVLVKVVLRYPLAVLQGRKALPPFSFVAHIGDAFVATISKTSKTTVYFSRCLYVGSLGE